MNSENPSQQVGKVSAIIVNWNGRGYLERLFNSLRTQTYKNIEVIMVDNSSEDDSVDYVKKNFPDVKVVESPNIGYGRACNLGAELASGEYLSFFNVDIYFPNDYFEKMVVFHKELSDDHRKIGGVGCKLVAFDSDPALVSVPHGGEIDLFGYPINKWHKDDIFGLCGNAFFIESSAYKEIGGFSDYIFLFGEDIEISWRARIFGYELFLNPNTYLYHVSGGSSSGFKSRKTAMLLASSIVPALCCHSTAFILAFPFYVLFIMLSLLLLTIHGRGDIATTKEYFKCVRSILKDIPGILKFRKFVQKKRVLSGTRVLKYISFVPSALYDRWWEKLSQKDLWS